MISASPVVDAGDGLALTVPALLAERAANRRDHPWLICDDETLTYGEAESRSAVLARGLLAAGAARGTHIGLFFPNGTDFVVAAYAAARIGAVVLPFSTLSTATELRSLLQRGDVELLIASRSYRGRDHVAAIRDAVDGLDLAARPPLASASHPKLRRIAFDGPVADAGSAWTMEGLISEGESIGDDALTAAESSVRPSDRLVIVHTSGSTSEPKGVIHQHGPLIRHQSNLNLLRPYREDEILFSPSPFFWIGGFAYSALATLIAGATIVCSNATDPAVTLDLLERVRPTSVNGFAATVNPLAAHPSFPSRDLSSIRRGNLWPILPPAIKPKDPDLRHNMLGMTETGSVCLMDPDESDQPEHRRGSFGKPVTGWEARVVDPDTGNDCEVGQMGELWLRSPFLMEGYYGKDRSVTFTPDGWFRGGDLFTVDSDGYYYFKGRRGDMIKTAGANVSPREVEAAILDATGLIAHVMGIEDDERGQLVVAAVRVPHGVAAPDPDELRTALRSRLSSYKVPRRIVLLPEHEVPMMSSGKIDARALKERLRTGP